MIKLQAALLCFLRSGPRIVIIAARADGPRPSWNHYQSKSHMKYSPKNHPEPDNVLYRVQRGLAGYVSYLAACEMKSAFNEYVLYEPILRILIARGYSVRCESPFPLVKKRKGDHKRIDFVARKATTLIALEVKWARKRKVSVKRDYDKLVAFQQKYPQAHCIICIFGQWDHTKNLSLPKDQFNLRLKPVYALMKATQYGCQIFELAAQ
jgi:hypothetical protein